MIITKSPMTPLFKSAHFVAMMMLCVSFTKIYSMAAPISSTHAAEEKTAQPSTSDSAPVLMPSSALLKEWATNGLRDRDMSPAALPKDLWAGLSIEDATLLIHNIPSSFADPIYRSIYVNLLLAPSKGFYVIEEDPKKNRNNDKQRYTTQSPTDEQWLNFIKLRFIKLYEMGAFKEAKQLYKALFNNKKPPLQTDLALHGLHHLLADGKLSAACLDIEAIPDDLATQPAFVDLKLFCDTYFKDNEPSQNESNATATAEESTELTFTHFKGLYPLLEKDRSITPQALTNFSLTETLIANALGRLNEQDYITHYKKDYNNIPTQTLHLLSLKTPSSPQNTCLMNESYRRGIIQADALLLHYRSLAFDKRSFEESSMQRHSLHPCLAPAWYVHWIEAADDREETKNRTSKTFTALIQNNPSHVAVYYPFFKDLDPASLSSYERWLLAQAKIRASDKFSKDWQKSVIKDTETDKSIVMADWYLQVLDSPDMFSVDDYITWSNTGLLDLPFENDFTPSRPLTLLNNMLNLKIYQQAIKAYYEKLFPLTFSRNYVIYDYSLISGVSASIENEQIGKSFLLLLRLLNAQQPADVYTGYIQSLLDILLRIEYDVFAKDLIMNTLSVGKK